MIQCAGGKFVCFSSAGRRFLALIRMRKTYQLRKPDPQSRLFFLGFRSH
jgi:hypothetical protein